MNPAASWWWVGWDAAPPYVAALDADLAVVLPATHSGLAFRVLQRYSSQAQTEQLLTVIGEERVESALVAYRLGDEWQVMVRGEIRVGPLSGASYSAESSGDRWHRVIIESAEWCVGDPAVVRFPEGAATVGSGIVPCCVLRPPSMPAERVSVSVHDPVPRPSRGGHDDLSSQRTNDGQDLEDAAVPGDQRDPALVAANGVNQEANPAPDPVACDPPASPAPPSGPVPVQTMGASATDRAPGTTPALRLSDGRTVTSAVPVVIGRIASRRNLERVGATSGAEAIDVHDPTHQVSGVHLEIRIGDDTVVVRDLGSTNGTTWTPRGGRSVALTRLADSTLDTDGVLTLGGVLEIAVDLG